MKYSKLSKRKENKLIEAFALGLPALTASIYAEVHRNTANKFFKKLRLKIAEETTRNVNLLKGEIEIDESYFGGKKKGKRGRGSTNKQIVFGILERGGKVRTILVHDVSAETLMKEIRENTEKGCVYFTDKFRSYNSLSRYGKHLQVDHGKEFNNGGSHINGIEGFWSYAKRFLRKYNGVKNFDLYIKEIEWRFNHRHDRHIKALLKKYI